MTSFKPAVPKELLDKGPGPSSFFVEKDGEIILNPDLPVFEQGHFLEMSDLNILFVKEGVTSYSPFNIIFSIGFVSGEEEPYEFHPIGNRERPPYEIRTGLFYPPATIGDIWKTGKYLIRWRYQVSQDSEWVVRDTPFIVKTKGLLDTPAHNVPQFDIPATVVVTP